MGKEIGEAYVKIMPTTKGIAGKIGEALENAEKGKEFLGAMKGWGKRIAIAAAGAIAAAKIGQVIGDAVSEGAKLEQSIGGIETLFGTGGKTLGQYAEAQGKSIAEAADEYWRLERAQTIVLNNADKAFKTAGLSANDYMEQATSFAASLVASLDGDTLAAASAADQAIIDMADNSNKMGTAMENIQSAYQGFAKQNYTMLDNLKLGYGGTKGEMERLLKDAQSISGIEYNIDNLADVYNAIHIIQTELGITGTTAKEAASTISGSAASMKAAWQNVLGKAALGEDVKEPMQELVETARTYLADNLLPAIGNVVRSIPSAFRQVGPGIREALPDMAAQGVQVIADFLQGIGDGAPGVGTLISDVMNTAWEKAKEIDWISIGTNLISGIIQGVINSAGRLYMQISQVIGNALVAAEQAGQIHSPSRLFRDRVGEMIPAGVAVGVKNKTSLVQDAVTEMVSQADRSFQLSPRQASGGGVTVNQNIYAKKQSAAELMAESRWQAEKAVLKLV